ncbi:hypothetical protein NDQ57_02490 [Rossellomorea marisflavi]|uniref:hypothetical protein n=1 Tax=Rossellomorea marisflavi TaxID=189381 RepID=UPI00203FB9A0|nr:hypothetical protein [Rossellomorea marisflavi]MCM2603573.1 hypothetical protein [Rossellomorea marisflavi]
MILDSIPYGTLLSRIRQCSAADGGRLTREWWTGETLQAQLKRLTVYPAGKRSTAAERNGPNMNTYLY